MQRLFSDRGPWPALWVRRVLPTIERLVARTPERTILTRFIPPNLPDDTPGMWRTYYARWPHVIRDAMDTSLLKLMPQLERFVPPAHVFFATGALHAFLQTKHVDTLILTESETDVCVLSTALSAIDLGYRTIIVKDGLCSSLDDAHDASFRLYEQRHHVQIELAEASEVMDVWALKPRTTIHSRWNSTLSDELQLATETTRGIPMAKKAKKATKRRYSKSSESDVEREVRRYKKGTAKSGRGGKGGKVKSRKQAIAIGLSKARKKGKKVPKKAASKKKTSKKKTSKKKS
jgi:nicotinamidase-related amidase